VNGVHDMGGMHGFGKVEPEVNEPPFHAPWEGRVLALQRAIRFTRAWNIDMSRDAQERLPAHVYLAASYYARWALGIESNAVAKKAR
jgi:nitrile hydratase